VLRVSVFLLLLAGSAAIGASYQVAPERVPVDLRLEQARKEAVEAEAELHRLEAAAAKAGDEVARLRAHQLAAAQAIEVAEAQITIADTAAKLAHARLSAQRQRLAAEQAPASALLGGLALTTRRPPLLLLAGGGSAEDLVKLRLLVAAIAPTVKARTAALATQLERTTALEKAAFAAREERLRTRDTLSRRREQLASLESRAVELAKSRGSAALRAGDVALATGEQASALERQVQSRRSTIGEARELAALGPAPLPPSPPVRRGINLDYMLPAEAAVTGGVGAVSANGVRSRGVTLATRRGSPLVAPASGTILLSGPFRDYDGVVIIDHGGAWKSVLVNAGSRFPKGTRIRIGEPLGIALGPIEVELRHGGEDVSPALIAGSSAMVSNMRKGG
jgi:septal ring factor EnvC (AmiA/AmiB activator)